MGYPKNMNSSSETAAGSPPDFLLLGGHPAIDFANTLVPPPGPGLEFFQSWRDVVAWLKATNLWDNERLRGKGSEAVKALESALDLRQAWKKVVAGIAEGHPVPASFVQRINSLLEQDTFVDALHQEGRMGFHLHRSPSRLEGGAGALAVLARTIADFLATADFQYLRHCANHESCVLYFYDTTKNHRRQWCSNALCGNRHKVAEFRRRQRSSRKAKA
jgi:predicted RNA-binding Zn ribbon-like protein